jgi:hypothetical protein
MIPQSVGAFFFGLVIGWVTYRTLRRSSVSGLSDIATVIGAVGGGAVTGLLSKESGAFGSYSVGLAIGFFLYLFIAVLFSRKAGKGKAVDEWLGEGPWQQAPAGRDKGGALESVAGSDPKRR